MKIVLIEARYLCYQSNTVFVEEMASALSSLGVEVEILEVSDEKTAGQKLKVLYGKSYDAVIDFNSVLSRAIDDNGICFPDYLDAPFINYIVDHPMFHHLYLEVPAKNMHAICVDKNHCEYLKKVIPSLKSVHFLPLGATTSNFEVDYCNKTTDILFSGTYMSSKMHLDFINEMDSTLRKQNLDLIEMLLEDSTLSLEKAVEKLGVLIKPQNIDFVPGCYNHLSNPLHPYYRADYYIRTFNRERLINGLSKAGLPLTIMGIDWENYSSNYKSKIKFIQGAGYRNSLQLMANSHFCLNVQPLFRAGVHDRVINTMLNKSISVTDTSSYIEDNFDTANDLIIYSPNKIDDLANTLSNLIADDQRQLEIINNGYAKAYTNHTWQTRMLELISIVEKINK